MKTIQYIVLILILGGLAPRVHSQQNPIITGQWALQYAPTVANMSPELKQRFNTMSHAFREKIRKAYQGRTFSFFDNGSYVQTLADGRRATGKWMLNNTELRLIDSSGGVLKFTILSFNNTALVIKANETGQSKLFLSQWYLTKTN